MNIPYGREDATIFLEQVLPAAPDVVVQLAHLAGAGPGYPASADAAMQVYAEAIVNNDTRTRNVYFDITTAVTTDTTADNAALIASRIRQMAPDDSRLVPISRSVAIQRRQRRGRCSSTRRL